jgi:hypothetical protein
MGRMTGMFHFAITVFQGVDPNNQGLAAVPALLHNAINIALIVAGGLSVIFAIVGGLRYVLSSGNPAEVNKAKDTLLFSVIGLVVASVAFAVVNFVVTRFFQ